MIKYLAVGVPVVSGVAATSIYFAWPSERSVASKIKTSLSEKDYLKLVESRDSGYWDKFRKLYKNFKGEKLGGVTDVTLPKWCEDTLRSKESSKTNREIEFANRWCVVDTRSVKSAAKSLGKVLVSDLPEGEQEAAWKSSWDHYRGNKEGKNLGIIDSKFTGSEGTSNTTGGSALKVWCTSKESMLMYEYGGEDSVYEKYVTWCVKQ